MSSLRSSVTLIILCLLLTACGKSDAELNELSSKIVIEGYVFANEPIKIKVANVNENGLSASVPIHNAHIKISQGNIALLFVESDSVPGEYIQLNQAQLMTDTGTIYLNVAHNGYNHTAHTIFPKKISNLEISTNSIELKPANLNATIATLSWEPVAGAAGYCIFLKNADAYPQSIVKSELYNAALSPFLRVSHQTSISLKSTDFPYTGNYEIYVSAIGAEYGAIYNGTGLNNLMGTNIENGWGVFTAFNGQAVSVIIY